MKMWAESVVSKVERSAQCYICYCRLHPTGGKLPNVTCYTCRNKFHNLCLVSCIIYRYEHVGIIIMNRWPLLS